MSTLFTQTASAATPIPLDASNVRDRAAWSEYIDTHYDRLYDEFRGEINESRLLDLFHKESQKNDTFTDMTRVRGNEVAHLNEDGAPMPYITWGQGWSYVHRVYPWRVAVKHTRRAEETENYGMVAQEAGELMDAGSRTIKYAASDVFNRALGTAGAPVLCIDGMYLLDADRPNAVPNVPNWNNLESTTAITEAAMFQASLNAQETLASNGDDMPLEIKSIIIPNNYEHEMWKLNNTPKTVGALINDANWAHGRFTYETLKELTSNLIFYRLSETNSPDNGLKWRWSVMPGIMATTPEDPDIMGKRLRFIFGIGCLDPRKCWRGGALTAL